MTVPTVQSIYEENDSRVLYSRIYIGGALLPRVLSLTYSFAMGQVPTATIEMNRADVPGAVKEEASVVIYVGFQVGIAQIDQLVFGGALVDSVSHNGPTTTIECLMDGPRRLNYSWYRRIDVSFESVGARDAIVAMLDQVGVVNYSVAAVLNAWSIGDFVPQTLQFNTYGEAINKVSTVDGSEWYAMPSGQVRVEKRDPIPADTARRTYFSGVLIGGNEVQPVGGVGNSNARPRILEATSSLDRAGIANWIEVDGAVVTTFGPNGEQNSDQIQAFDDAAPGVFANGTAWIPTPPLFQQFTYSNELIDSDPKAAEVVARYLDLKNRLIENVPLTIPCDPDVFLGETIAVKDPRYSGVDSLYFVNSYRTTISDTDATTQLELLGGPYAGTAGHIAPFAEFVWKYRAIHNIIGAGILTGFEEASGCDIGSKLCQPLPADTGTPGQGGSLSSGEDKPMVYITFDGTVAADFDGYIISYLWTDDNGHTGSGPFFTVVYDPDAVSSVEMTLRVTDNTGRTDTITKTVYTSATHLDLPPDTDQDPPMCDTPQGGGVGVGECCNPDTGDCGSPPPGGGDVTGKNPGGQPPEGGGAGGCQGITAGYFLAAEAYAMGTPDSLTWNDLAVADAGATGLFISVASIIDSGLQQNIALFGTDTGDIVRTTDLCATGEVVFNAGAAVNCIWFDSQEGGGPGNGQSDADIPVFTQDDPGVLTIVQAFQQCLAVGFSKDLAIIAVAIMIAESGLASDATGFNPGPPSSTDRGIAQINDLYHPEVTDECAYATDCAIAAMFTISSGGGDFSPWSTFTGGAYLSHLAAVQLATDGFKGTPGSSGVAWAGTANGKVFRSDNGGTVWVQHVDFGDGFPINVIGTPPGGSLWVFGGDTGVPESLIRIDPNKDGNFVFLPFGGDLFAAIQAAGSGYTLTTSATNQTASLIGFSGGVSPPVWTSVNPIWEPDSWIPATDFSDSGVLSSAPGFNGDFVVAADSSSVDDITTNNQEFTQGTIPDRINQIVWQGLQGTYLGASDSGLLTTIDEGATWGYLRPNATFGTLWPVGAVARQIAFAVGPRKCTPVACPLLAPISHGVVHNEGQFTIGVPPLVGIFDLILVFAFPYSPSSFVVDISGAASSWTEVAGFTSSWGLAPELSMSVWQGRGIDASADIVITTTGFPPIGGDVPTVIVYSVFAAANGFSLLSEDQAVAVANAVAGDPVDVITDHTTSKALVVFSMSDTDVGSLSPAPTSSVQDTGTDGTSTIVLDTAVYDSPAVAPVTTSPASIAATTSGFLATIALELRCDENQSLTFDPDNMDVARESFEVIGDYEGDIFPPNSLVIFSAWFHNEIGDITTQLSPSGITGGGRDWVEIDTIGVFKAFFGKGGDDTRAFFEASWEVGGPTAENEVLYAVVPFKPYDTDTGPSNPLTKLGIAIGGVSPIPSFDPAGIVEQDGSALDFGIDVALFEQATDPIVAVDADEYRITFIGDLFTP